MNPCVVPEVPQPYESEILDGDRWTHIHNRFINETKEREPDVIIFGDSIMVDLEQRSVWTEVFAPMHTLNFSIAGDKIQNILWRVQSGELDNIKPKVVILYAGEKNIQSTDPKDVADGIAEVAKTIREKQPEALILVQELLPRGLNPNPLRDSIEKLNALLKPVLQGVPHLKVVPTGSDLIKPDGTISHVDLFDWYHPTNEGCKKAFGPLINELKSIFEERRTED
ncbi:hypothetical protein ONE63_007679 [Megalurothrips usitatus]|uniref:SGNH hydrolase-type esterase domain-containing protein n=1 Tax=Megalurothrips usitatus TaxID=439358 RepID=A0AAV7XPI1_9NEOP|nr:hypothetical protein ONE63_007679 [Megalurothrips usitatus]